MEIVVLVSVVCQPQTTQAIQKSVFHVMNVIQILTRNALKIQTRVATQKHARLQPLVTTNPILDNSEGSSTTNTFFT